MSAAEVIEQIRALPAEDQARVREFVTTELPARADEPNVMDRQTFEKAKNYVFENYGDLLRKLAQ